MTMNINHMSHDIVELHRATFNVISQLHIRCHTQSVSIPMVAQCTIENLHLVPEY